MSMTAKEMCDLVAQKLKEHDWRFRLRDFGDGEFAVDSDVSSKSGVFRFYERRFLFQRAEMRTIYYLPVKAPEAMRQGAADYITRINWRTRYGKFMMDFDDGELRYECIFGEPAIKADVDDVLGDSIDMMRSTLDRYAAGLMAVLGGGKSAEAAFQEAIKPKEAPAPAPEGGMRNPRQNRLRPNRAAILRRRRRQKCLLSRRLLYRRKRAGRRGPRRPRTIR